MLVPKGTLPTEFRRYAADGIVESALLGARAQLRQHRDRPSAFSMFLEVQFGHMALCPRLSGFLASGGAPSFLGGRYRRPIFVHENGRAFSGHLESVSCLSVAIQPRGHL
jgi:hypothetical protein